VHLVASAAKIQPPADPGASSGHPALRWLPLVDFEKMSYLFSRHVLQEACLELISVDQLVRRERL
jgi:hypothetical protein